QNQRCLLSYVLGPERRKLLADFGIRFVNCGHIGQEKQLLPDFFAGPVRDGIDQSVQDSVPSLVICMPDLLVLVQLRDHVSRRSEVVQSGAVARKSMKVGLACLGAWMI